MTGSHSVSYQQPTGKEVLFRHTLYIPTKEFIKTKSEHPLKAEPKINYDTFTARFVVYGLILIVITSLAVVADLVLAIPIETILLGYVLLATLLVIISPFA